MNTTLHKLNVIVAILMGIPTQTAIGEKFLVELEMILTHCKKQR
jgi:hypothetical protein